jgi:putative SOS response-associated peptidase YedK
MCGRFTLKSKANTLADLFQLSEVPPLEPRYNIAPTQPVAAVRQQAENGRELAMLRWGLIPSWARDPKEYSAKCINARSETVAQKPAFRSAFRDRRCLIPADGFFEWQQQGKGKKQPFYFTLPDGQPFAFAGLWEAWSGPDGDVQTCTLLTTAANEVVRPVHERMPVILDPKVFEQWLDPRLREPGVLQELLQTCRVERLTAVRVSPLVNNARNDGPECVAPLPPPSPTTFPLFF